MRYFCQECILRNRHPAQSGHRNDRSDRLNARRDFPHAAAPFIARGRVMKWFAPGSTGLIGAPLAWRENATPSAKDNAWCRNA